MSYQQACREPTYSHRSHCSRSRWSLDSAACSSPSANNKHIHLGFISVGLRAAIQAEHCATAQTRHLGNIFEWSCVCDTSTVTNEAAHESDMKIPRASIKREREVRVRGRTGCKRSHAVAWACARNTQCAIAAGPLPQDSSYDTVSLARSLTYSIAGLTNFHGVWPFTLPLRQAQRPCRPENRQCLNDDQRARQLPAMV